MRAHPSARCRALVARLSRFIDGELGARERRAVLAHLARCPCCDDFVASLQRTVRVCREAGRTRLPAAVRATALARVRRLLATVECAEPPTGRAVRRPSR